MENLCKTICQFSVKPKVEKAGFQIDFPFILLFIERKPVYGFSHKVKIQLPASYPIMEPSSSMLTSLYHPHIYPSLKICIGRNRITSEYLDLFVKRIGSIIIFDPVYFDYRSPANSDALNWVKNNMHLFPTDKIKIFESQELDKKKMSWRNIK